MALQKRLLVAESELNRAQLLQEMQTLVYGAREFTRRATTVGTWISSVALLLAGIRALWKGTPHPPEAKPSLTKRILNLTHLGSTVWFAARSRWHHG